MWAYYYIYENWKIYELPWDSLFTWIAAALLTDLGYYWGHRAAHEINLLWAAHQAQLDDCVGNESLETLF